MKRFYIVLGLCLFLGACAKNSGVANDFNIKECKNDKDKIGGCIERVLFDDGDLKYKRLYENGELVWEENHNVGGNGYYEYSYKNGELVLEKSYSSDGKMNYEIPYENGLFKGVTKWYYENGNLNTETPYMRNYGDTKVDGLFKYYTRDGKLLYQLPYDLGIVNGIGLVYDDNGDVAVSVLFQNSSVVSIQCANGNLPNIKNIKNKDINEILLKREVQMDLCDYNIDGDYI